MTNIRPIAGIKTVALLACILLISCASTDPQKNGVTRGMTQDQVLEIMGEPTQKKTNGYCVEGKACNESWIYYGRHIVFSDGVVVGF